MNFIEAIEFAGTPEELSGIFNALSLQKNDERRRVIDAVETALVPEFMQTIHFFQSSAEFEKKIQAYAEGRFDRDDAHYFEGWLVLGTQRMETVLFEIHKIKKDDSHPLVKAFLSQSMLMEEKERNSVVACYKTLRKIQLPKV